MIPVFERGAHYLPPGIHPATLDAIENAFVEGAPYPKQRRIVFDTFRVWFEIVSDILPDARFWINGGFVTHKDWAPPDDVDVVILAKQHDLNSLDSEQQELLASLMTVTEPVRIQPMSGMVDAFICVRGDIDWTLIWRETWSTLTDRDKEPVQGIQKGFLEVKP